MTTHRSTTECLECVPLYALTDPKTDALEFLGSGTLIAVQGHHLLVTAGHVIDNGKAYQLRAAIPGDTVLFDRPLTLLTPVQAGLTRQSDPLDICVVCLSPREVERLRAKCRFIDWEREALLDFPLIEYPHKITGYPDTENIPNVETKTLCTNCLRVDVREDRSVIQHAPAEGIKAHPTWYLGVRYDPRLLEPRDTQPKVKSLHGCSGGAIWRTDGTSVLGFAGIVIQCLSPKARRTGERIVYGLRAKAIDDLLSRWIEEGRLA